MTTKKTKVIEKNSKFEYQESVNEFAGMSFHCPDCDAELHIHVAHVAMEKLKRK